MQIFHKFWKDGGKMTLKVMKKSCLTTSNQLCKLVVKTDLAFMNLLPLGWKITLVKNVFNSIGLPPVTECHSAGQKKKKEVTQEKVNNLKKRNKKK